MLRVYRKKGAPVEIDSTYIEFKIGVAHYAISCTDKKTLCIRKVNFEGGDQISVLPNCTNQIYIK